MICEEFSGYSPEQPACLLMLLSCKHSEESTDSIKDPSINAYVCTMLFCSKGMGKWNCVFAASKADGTQRKFSPSTLSRISNSSMQHPYDWDAIGDWP